MVGGLAGARTDDPEAAYAYVRTGPAGGPVSGPVTSRHDKQAGWRWLASWLAGWLAGLRVT